MTDSKKQNGDGKGLGPRKRPAAAKRPARPSAYAARPVKRPSAGEFEPVKIDRHRDLAGRQREIFRRLAANPEISVLLTVNPVLALKELGVSFSNEMRDHVLRSVQHSPRLAKRRKMLVDELEKALGEPPRPNDSRWLADVLFSKLELEPLVTRGRTPAYKPAANAQMIERLSKRRVGQTWKKGNPHDPRPERVSRIVLKDWRPAVRRMDLDAELPALNKAKQRPKTISLQSLYFYKDSHPLARQLLELGIIQQQSFPIHTGDAYRKVRDGKKPNAFRAWVRSVRFDTD